MKKSPSWETNKSSAIQENPRILWKPNVHYRIHKGPLPVHILSRIIPVDALPIQLLEDRFNIIPPSTPGSSKWFLPPGRTTKILYAPLFSTTCATCPAYLISLNDYRNNIWWGLQIIKLRETWVLLASLVCIPHKILLT